VSRYKKEADGQKAHILTLRVFLVVIILALSYAMYGWKESPKRITIDIPPDLRAGASQKIGERHPSSIYSFGYYIFQQLNNWPISGTKDYQKRIDSLSCYITPKFKGTLERDKDKRERLNELNRQRAMQQIPGHGYSPKRVYMHGGDSWVAFYDISVKETFRSEMIKDIFVRYPLNIVAYTADPECNPWGLAIDGYYRKPNRLEDDKLESAKNDKLASIE